MRLLNPNLGFYEENPISEIAGMLLSDLRPNGTVRMIFITDRSGGNELALEVKDLDTAELDFVLTFGLTSELAAALRGDWNAIRCSARE